MPSSDLDYIASNVNTALRALRRASGRAETHRDQGLAEDLTEHVFALRALANTLHRPKRPAMRCQLSLVDRAYPSEAPVDSVP